MQHKVMWKDRPSLLQYSLTYIVSFLALYGLRWAQAYLGLSAGAWVGNLHFQSIMMNWQQQGYLLIDLVIDAMIFVVLINTVFKILQSLVTRYIVMDDQLIIRELTPMGMNEERLELYRIVDFELSQSFFGMLFRYGNVMLRTNDQARPRMILTGFRRGQDFIDMLRQETERCRQLKGVREITMPVGPQ